MKKCTHPREKKYEEKKLTTTRDHLDGPRAKKGLKKKELPSVKKKPTTTRDHLDGPRAKKKKNSQAPKKKELPSVKKNPPLQETTLTGPEPHQLHLTAFSCSLSP
jgi:hypothetical protein